MFHRCSRGDSSLPLPTTHLRWWLGNFYRRCLSTNRIWMYRHGHVLGVQKRLLLCWRRNLLEFCRTYFCSKKSRMWRFSSRHCCSSRPSGSRRNPFWITGLKITQTGTRVYSSVCQALTMLSRRQTVSSRTDLRIAIDCRMVHVRCCFLRNPRWPQQCGRRLTKSIETTKSSDYDEVRSVVSKDW